ncbi:hypothetical protein BJY00DRAFT_304968 [Aspergillus carlsbadensis]|nr:hypothetical protein BJY00DRAFT_304968 [Aspergillus carlsbadensis]
MPRERIEDEEPPTALEIFFFPLRIVRFNLRPQEMAQDPIEDFKNLVVDNKTKGLAQALITNRLEFEQGTDMIDNKANGLTTLLHGGPGTGKTFTAESVAELAEKPLYRATCGDIGTQPENVEVYILGDVFLQERTVADLQRAPITVFPRVLKYYDGILIITTNRIRTFAEALMFRIQISLHYSNLKRSQMLQVWGNLLNRLKRLEELDINFDDGECYISELADQEMNGREFRNAIPMSPQLAKPVKTSHACPHDTS